MDRKQRIVSECKVEYLRLNQRISALSEDISYFGTFVRTDLYLPRGEMLELSITVPDGKCVRVLGRVAHILPEGAARALGRRAGMGIEFQGRLPRALRTWLDRRMEETGVASIDFKTRMSVLIADRRTPILERLTGSLAGAGFRVRVTSSAEDALDRAAAEPPDVVLADVGLASRDGWRLLKQFASTPALARVRTMIMAHEPDDMTRLEAYRLGVADFIHEPFTDEEICLRLRRLGAQAPAEADKAALRGSIGEGGIGMVLALLDFERRSGLLIVMREDRTARLYVSAGQVVKVEGIPELDSRDSLMEVLGWQGGSFELVAAEVTEPDEIGLSTSNVLLEHARLQDEEARPAPVSIDETTIPAGGMSFADLDAEITPEVPPAVAPAPEMPASVALPTGVVLDGDRTFVSSPPASDDSVGSFDVTHVRSPASDYSVGSFDVTHVRSTASDGAPLELARASASAVGSTPDFDATHVSQPREDAVAARGRHHVHSRHRRHRKRH